MFCGYVIRGDMFYTIFAACLFANRKLLISLIKTTQTSNVKLHFLLQKINGCASVTVQLFYLFFKMQDV